MPAARPSSPLTRRGLAAIVLFLLGLGGMIRHFWASPEPPPAGIPLTASTYKAPKLLQRPVSSSGSARGSEAAPDLRRRLREFIIPLPGIIHQPPTDALALLQHFWETLPHETAAVPPASFTLTDSALAQLQSSTPPLTVSLEIPGVCLLTHLQLLAAQTGLHLQITQAGVTFDLPKRPPSQSVQTSSYPLYPTMLQLFTTRSLQAYRASNPTDPFPPNESFLTLKDGVRVSIVLSKPPASLPGNFVDDLNEVSIGSLPEPTDLEAPRISNWMTQSNQAKALGKLFAAMGIAGRQGSTELANNAESNPVIWDPEDSTLTATGSKRTQLIVAQTTAAILESANSGARIEFAVVDWQDDTPPVAPPRGNRAKASGGHGTQESNTKESRRLPCGCSVACPCQTRFHPCV